MTDRKRRLLVVEDEPLLGVAIADALRQEGWIVDVAEDGARGEELFKQHSPELVLVDLVMPQMDGMELLRRIKAVDPECTVVMITAHGSVERAVEAMRDGAADFITKPFRMNQLVVRLAHGITSGPTECKRLWFHPLRTHQRAVLANNKRLRERREG